MSATPLTIAAPNTEAKRKIFGMIQAFWQSQCLYVATRLGIFNLLHDEGAQSAETLAEKTETKVERLYVVLRALAHLDVLAERPDRIFAPTHIGLISDQSRTLDRAFCHAHHRACPVGRLESTRSRFAHWRRGV